MFVVGGYSDKGSILNSTENQSISRNWTVTYHKDEDSSHDLCYTCRVRYNRGRGTRLADMSQARSGHGCSLLTSDRSKIIVSGGSYTDNGEAVDTTEVYDVSKDQWTSAQSMKQAR